MTMDSAIIRRLASTTVACAAIAVLASVPAHASDWPQFRGPTGQGHAPDAAVPLARSETENVTWGTVLVDPLDRVTAASRTPLPCWTMSRANRSPSIAGTTSHRSPFGP